MTHLNIQQGQNIEVVSTNLIKKLYEAALSVPEPLEGEQDAAYLSGNLQVDKSYRAQVEYLTNRFDDLHINVTDSYYIPFEDNAVLSALLANNIGDGVGITESNALSVTNMSQLGLTGNSNITSFTELREFKNITTGSTDYFAGCTNLEWIALPENNNNIGVSYLISGGKKIKWVVPSVEFACSKEFNSWYNNPARGGGSDTAWTLYDLDKQPIDDVIIPEGVTCIGKYVFGKMSCNSLSIPSTITQIRQNAFENVSVTQGFSLNLHNLTDLSQGSFLGCTGLTGVTDLGSITYIPASCFYGCTSLTSVILPETCTSFRGQCFYECTSLSEVTFPSQSTISYSDGNYWGVFNGCTSLIKINNLQNLFGFIKERTFNRCPLTSNSLSELINITGIGSAVFEGSGIKSSGTTTLPNITSIGSSGFLGCTNLTGTLSFPNLTSIGNRAFYNCTGITSLDFTGSTFTSVSNEVFRNCSNLSKIKLPTTVTALYEGWGRGINNTLYICGLDNISTHSTNSWTLTNTTIINPIKTSIITDSNIVDWSDNRLTVRLHSIYEPLRTSTVRTSQVANGQPKSSHFVYNCLGGSGSFTIGLLYYRDITSFGDATFFRCNIENLVINNITPPTLNNSDTTFSGEYYWQNWGNNIFGNQNASSDAFLHDHAIIGTLWVPDSAVATYQANPQYSSLTIKGINTKTNGVDYDLPRYTDFAAWEAAEEAAVAQGGHAPQGLIEAWM